MPPTRVGSPLTSLGRNVATEAKKLPRFVEHIDLDREGQSTVLPVICAHRAPLRVWTVGSFGHDLETVSAHQSSTRVSASRQTRRDLRHVKASLGDLHHEPEGGLIVEFDSPSVEVEEHHRR